MSWSVVFGVAWAVSVLASGDVLRACSEDGTLGSDGLVGEGLRKEFLRIPNGT